LIRLDKKEQLIKLFVCSANRWVHWRNTDCGCLFVVKSAGFLCQNI